MSELKLGDEVTPSEVFLTTWKESRYIGLKGIIGTVTAISTDGYISVCWNAESKLTLFYCDVSAIELWHSSNLSLAPSKVLTKFEMKKREETLWEANGKETIFNTSMPCELEMIIDE